MAAQGTQPKFSLKCTHCQTVGVPVRVESHTLTTIALALQCRGCGREWTTQGDLPVFLAWVKPDRRRSVVDRKRLH